MTTSTDANSPAGYQSEPDESYASANWLRAGGHAVDHHAAWLEQQLGGSGNEDYAEHALRVPATATFRRGRSRPPPRSSNGGSSMAATASSSAAVRRRSRTVMRVSQVAGGLQEGFGGDTTSTLSVRRDEQVPVYVYVVFLKIGEIDTIKEKFGADVYIQARWREPLFDDEMQTFRPSEVAWSQYWNPRLHVDNVAADNSKEQIWKTVLWKNGSEAFVFERRRVAGHFTENYDLSQFPFDTQDITLTIVSERQDSELILHEEPGELSTVNVQSFVNEQEWRLYNNVETQQETVTRVYQDDESTHPSFTAICHASRRFGFYCWNVLFVMFFVSSMVFTSFAVDIHKTENRIQTTLVVILTTVTFKFTVNQSLPRISYLTYLDKYILSSMATMCLICAWHALSPFITDDDGEISDYADKYALVAFASLFILAHISFYLFIYFAAIYRRRAYVAKERRREVFRLEDQERCRQRRETRISQQQITEQLEQHFREAYSMERFTLQPRLSEN